MEKIRISPFVKWAGGKTQLLTRLEERMPSSFNRYYEPFIGGGAFLLATQPENAVINDVNEQLMNVYRQIKSNPDALISILHRFDKAGCDKEHYIEMREQYNQRIAGHILDAECAAYTIWINKHCFNGLYRVNSKGLFNVPYNQKNGGSSMDESNILGISAYLNQHTVELRQGDFEEACADVQKGDFVYFDSPYIPVSDTANFTDYTKDGFRYEDHCRLSRLFKKLDEMGVKVMLSNHNVDLVYELYDGYRIESVDVKRAINSDATKRAGKEVIITNY